ncbi:VanZ family protein [bacterium]|nr:VanZ family protein [bacterium]
MQMVLIWNTCWWLLLVLWTIGLLRPEPIQMQHELISPALGWVTAKGLHLGVYALLAFFASNLPGTYSNKLICCVILVAHAFATEFLQQWVKERTGSLSDVAIDLLGVALGLGVWKLYRWFGPAKKKAPSR